MRPVSVRPWPGPHRPHNFPRPRDPNDFADFVAPPHQIRPDRRGAISPNFRAPARLSAFCAATLTLNPPDDSQLERRMNQRLVTLVDVLSRVSLRSAISPVACNMPPAVERRS